MEALVSKWARYKAIVGLLLEVRSDLLEMTEGYDM